MVLKWFFSVVVVLLGLYFVVDYTKPALDLHQSWVDYKKEFNRTYGAADDLVHLAIFEESVKIITAHNERYDQGLETYTMGLNQFSDMAEIELNKSMYSGYCAYEKFASYKFYGDSTSGTTHPPDSIDWRDQDAVTPVKNQWLYPSCWAFSAIGAIESAMKIHKGKKPISLSAQQLVDCEQNNNARGGDMLSAYNYTMQYKGLQSESDYPYTATKGDCKYNQSNVIVNISGYIQIEEPNEDKLKNACGIIGPIVAGIETTSNFRRYKSGIFIDKNCKGEANHGVLVVGYGNDGVNDYWIIKNSYGTTWGESGYMKLARNHNSMCSIGSDLCVYPVVSWVK